MKLDATIVISLTLLLLSGCQKHVLLSSHTVLGADLSSTNGVNGVLGFKRSELAVIPKKDDGSTHSTVMTLDNIYDFGSRYCINQAIATGTAALASASADTTEDPIFRSSPTRAITNPTPTNTDNSKAPMIFSTYTSWGLADINVSTNGPQNSVSVFHYKRSEGVVVPVESSGNIRPVYGRYFFNDETGEEATHLQIMATGEAAELYASNFGAGNDGSYQCNTNNSEQ